MSPLLRELQGPTVVSFIEMRLSYTLDLLGEIRWFDLHSFDTFRLYFDHVSTSFQDFSLDFV